MYEDEYLDDELDEELEDEYDGGTSNSNISDKIKDKINQTKEDSLRDEIESAKNKDDDKNSNKGNNEKDSDSKNKGDEKKKQDQSNSNQDPSKQLTQKNKPNKKPNSDNNASDELGNKIKGAKNKMQQGMGKGTPGGNMGSSGEGLKEGLKNTAKEGGKKAASGAKQAAAKAGQATAKAAQAAGHALIEFLTTNPYGWVVLIVIAVIFIIFVVLLLIFSSTAGNEETSTYTYDPKSTNKIEFMCAMVNPTSNKKEMTNNKVTSFFGHRSINYGSKYHRGVDLSMPDGAKIYAVQDGKVIYKGLYGTGGYTIKIKHKNGFTSFYLHMKRFGSFSVGDSIKQGDIVGYAGGTGANAPAYQFGVHLHIGMKDEKGNFFSLNPFFGISDEGYEECTKSAVPKMGRLACSIQNAARKANKINFQKEVCSKYNANGKGNIQSGYDFVKKLEGTTKKCTTKDGKSGYMTENEGDGTVTVGFGFTNHPIGEQKYTDMINKSGYSHLFVKNGKHYKMKVGVCIPKTLADAMSQQEYNDKLKVVKNKVGKYNLEMSEHQIAALTSFGYQSGTNDALTNLLVAYKYYDNPKYVKKKYTNKYEGLWSRMSLYYNPGTKFEKGLKKRRKAEFALFVTGDYTDKGKFYSRNLKNYAYYDSEGVMARVK